MKVKFKFGDAEIEVSQEDELEGICKSCNPFLSMFSKSNLEYFNKTYEKFFSNMTKYYEKTGKAFEEYLKNGNPENTRDNPNVLPATGHDIYNYVARYGIANFHLQAVMRLDGKLDYNKLEEAVRLSIDAQPVLGCRFVESDSPYWERVDNIDKTTLCSMMETEIPDEAIQCFLESSLDMDNDPMVKVKLIRSGSYDTLCIKINHACSDGTGAKEYVQLLSEIYSAISQENGVFIPKPCERGRKEQDRLFHALGIADPESEWIPGSEIMRATWPFPWNFVQSETFHISTCKISREQLDEMIHYAITMKATVNDLILTAYYRAMLEMGIPIYGESMEIPITVDLRRFLPDCRTEAIRNFSGSEITKIAMVPNESFGETLDRVIPVMREIKNNRPGLQSAIGLERLEKLPWAETLAYYENVSKWPCVCGQKCAPVLSNLGIISDSLLRFGDNYVTDAYIVPPVVRPPSILLMVSTYNGILTLASGFYESTIRRKGMEKLLKNIRDELSEGCR